MVLTKEGVIDVSKLIYQPVTMVKNLTKFLCHFKVDFFTYFKSYTRIPTKIATQVSYNFFKSSKTVFENFNQQTMDPFAFGNKNSFGILLSTKT